MDIQYKARTVQEAEAILAFWSGRGYKFDTKMGLDTLTETAKWYFDDYPYVVVYHNRRKISGYTYQQEYKIVSFVDIFNIQPEKMVNVILNNEYTAEVSENGIKVGCQTFSLEIVEKLVAAKKEVLNS